ncbi:MAG: TIGR00296 family protein [Candidatus Bathyarchaeota archaeon]|nr:TIGR00296 family protein [Candidatus Bathyarchaeota archaeon]MCX8177327.1 TIGR00296 family protein [Candidatus Bathyarchaeota archaeon]MDW8193773.1 TIGR00296 family protein [Nitrososphaerota archaeon]
MSFDLSLEEGILLVKLARSAVEEYLKNGKRIKAPDETPEKLLQPCGVFVTINKVVDDGKELRGCIGYPYPSSPLIEAVIDSAISSATGDPRFPPLSKKELDSIVFEVSVLTPPMMVEVEKPTDYPSKIRVGRDGLIIERGFYKGLLLPQVPVEWGWNEEEFLCQCCLKAGLPPDCWLMKGTKVYTFQAIIFEEESPKGKVKRRVLDVKT